MKRIFLPELLTCSNGIKAGSVIGPDPKVLHRVKDVLRAEEGSVFEFIDGNGLIVTAEFIKRDGNFAVRKVNRVEKSNSNEICAVVSMIRRERFDLMVEKAVELGVDRIIPFRSERSRPYANESYEKLRDRWQRIADQALSQCKRDFRCTIEPICTLESVKLLIKDYQNKIGLDPAGPSINELNLGITKSTMFIIGPEGGFTDEEISKIRSWGIELYSISNNILRTETAVFYALSVLNFLKFR